METVLKMSAKTYSVYFHKRKQPKSLKRMKFATFDVETKDGLIGKELFCWNLYYFDKNSKNSDKMECIYEESEDFSSLFSYFKRRNDEIKTKQKKLSTLTVYVHNLSFEIRFLVDFAKRKGIKYSHITPHSNSILIDFPEFNVKFIDTLQFLQCSQEKAEIYFDVNTEFRKEKTKKTNYIFEKPYSKWTKQNKSEVKKHNINDTKALYDIMNKYRQYLFDLTYVDILSHASLSSVSIRSFQIYMEKDILNPYIRMKKNPVSGKIKYLLDVDKWKFVNEAYYGGITELFHKGLFEKGAVSFDINSSYPHQMESNQMPSGNCNWVLDVNILQNIISGRDNRLGFIECIVKPNERDNYPFLPDRVLMNDADGKKTPNTLYSSHERRAIYTTCELIEAYKRDYKITPIKGLIFEEKEFMFKNFINKLYNERVNQKSGNLGIVVVIKGILVRLYGKFGETFIRKTIVDEQFFNNKQDAIEFMGALTSEIATSECIKMNDGTYLVQIKEYVEKISSRKLPHIAVFTTAYGRLQLNRKIKEFESQNVPVLYSDSDSVWIPYEYKDNYQDELQLGGWKLEHIGIKAQFLALKKYVYTEENKGKEQLHITFNGMDSKYRRKLEKENNFEDTIEKVSKLMVYDEKFKPLKSAIRSGAILTSDNRKLNPTLKTGKRLFLKNGKSKPIFKIKDYSQIKRLKDSEYDKITSRL